MNNILTIFKKELHSFFTSPMAYIFLVVFALINGYFFNIQFFLINESDLRVLFGIVPLVYLFFIPAISMGLISREKSLGTIEIISTMPILERDIVIGKYLAGFVLIILGLAVAFFVVKKDTENIENLASQQQEVVEESKPETSGSGLLARARSQQDLD